VGVQVYVDAVINHMIKHGHQSGVGGVTTSGGSAFDTRNWDGPTFNGTYTADDFHSGCTINEGVKESIQQCALLGLVDLKTSSSIVQDRISSYLNTLISYGVSGFRIDAAKHIPDTELEAIIQKLDYGTTGRKPYVFMEVIPDSVISYADYNRMGPVLEFETGKHLSSAFWYQTSTLCPNPHGSASDLKGFGTSEWKMTDSDNAISFVDNHDTNRHSKDSPHNCILSAPLQNGTGISRSYESAMAFLVSHPYGYPLVTSTYQFSTSDQGAPGLGWLHEHRMPVIAQLVELRNVGWGKVNPSSHTMVDNWWQHNTYPNMIGFGRGGMAYVVINGDRVITLIADIDTHLPAGTYCDVVTGHVNSAGTGCVPITAKIVTVSPVNGQAQFIINKHANEAPAMGIHAGSRFNLPNIVPSAVTGGFSRTRLMVHYNTNGGSFGIKGGHDYSSRFGCTPLINDACAIDIKGTHRLNWQVDTAMTWTAGDYWVLDISMDCTQTEKGFFELKFINNVGAMESTIENIATDKIIYVNGNSGNDYTIVPRSGSTNHWAACGLNNVFVWESTETVFTLL
jgi:alpha-amylase